MAITTIVLDPNLNDPPAVGSCCCGDGSGGGGGSFSFTQLTPATVWTINHNLGFLPDVMLFDAGGNVIRAEITNPSVNQTIVTFLIAAAGSARLS